MAAFAFVLGFAQTTAKICADLPAASIIGLLALTAYTYASGVYIQTARIHRADLPYLRKERIPPASGKSDNPIR